jgi:RimJ/RimL family protein N-acetyltransferase
LENFTIKTGQIKDYLSFTQNINKREINYLIDNFYSNNDFIFTFYLNEKPILGLILCKETTSDRTFLIYNFSAENKELIKFYGKFFLKKIMDNFSGKSILYGFEYYFSEKNTPFYSEIMDVLSVCNFKNKQTKLKLVLKNNDKIISEKFNFEPINIIGQNLFIQTLQKISSNSLDSEDIEYQQKFGAEKASLKYFNDLKKQNYCPKFWELAFKENSLIGLIISQIENENIGSISYIGILPKMRGHQYIDQLIIRSINNLKHKNKIIAETDIENKPMINAFLRNGFVVYDKIFLFEKLNC